MRWIVKPVKKTPTSLQKLSLNPITQKLLLTRGIENFEETKKFLNARYEDLRIPIEIKGVKEAVERIGEARNRSEKVAIFGDYDADGITSTALLKTVLEEIGITPECYIPDRNKEGYGLNKKAVDFIVSEYKTRLLITVDCGISNWEEIEYARKKGMEIIVTDHHAIPKKIPASCILINPKLSDKKASYTDMAGVGVTFKLAQALINEFAPKKKEQTKWLLDLVAIGTIADCVPLLGENRILAKFGLVVLQKTKRAGIQELIKVARLMIDEKNPPSSENVAYQIGPRLNAAGRVDHADLTLSLLLEKDSKRARLLALEIENKNSQRQKLTQQVYSEVKKSLSDKKSHRLIVAKGENWPLGILGIVAGKLADEYHCPVFILRETKEIIEGSGRSIDAFNLIEAVSQIDSLVEKYGGHSQAMGLKIKPKNLAAFKKKLKKIIDAVFDEKTWRKSVLIDAEISADKIDWDILSEIRKFEPFGEGNEEPIFVCRDLKISGIAQVGNGQKHLKLSLESLGSSPKKFDGIYFKGGGRFSEFKSGDEVSVAYNLRSSQWSGNHKIELNIIDIKKE